MITDTGAAPKVTPQQKWNAANPLARWAHGAVQSAIRKGLLERKCCEVCGAKEAEFHHPSYQTPLIGQWLCRLHHRRLHAEERRRAADG